MSCYSGPNPVTDEERVAIWRWAKANGIDHGLPIEKVGDAINQHFFNGMADPKWIPDILSGRKTPFRQLSDAAWKAQYNRRQIVLQAKAITKEQAQNPVARTLQKLWNIPRSAAVFGHGIVFPVTHGGDLALRPQSWGVFMRGLLNTWTKSWSPAATERLLDSMRRNRLYDTALRSKLDVGEGSRLTDLVTVTKKGSPSERAWSILQAMRFELWDHAMQKFTNPTMPQEQVLEIGTNLAEWANHATGSAKGGLASLPGVSNVIFGPKLTQSKLSRIFSDPVKTINTLANWNNATAGERAVALTRLSGAAQYGITGLGMLAVNQGVLMALSGKSNYKDLDQKDRINFTDPTKGDFLSFKGGGLEFSVPGMHSEFKALGKMLAASYESYLWANPKFVAQQKALGKRRPFPAPDPLGELIKYARNKASPTVGIAADILTGKDSLGKPVPWSPDPGKPSWPRLDAWQYAFAHGPIPFSEPIRYFYDQMRDKGASALDAVAITRGLILFGLGATGMHVSPDYAAAKEAAKRQQVARALQQR